MIFLFSDKCINGEYTNEPFKGCKTCGNTVRVKCKKKNYGFVNSGGCNPINCKQFTGDEKQKVGSAGLQTGISLKT